MGGNGSFSHTAAWGVWGIHCLASRTTFERPQTLPGAQASTITYGGSESERISTKVRPKSRSAPPALSNSRGAVAPLAEVPACAPADRHQGPGVRARRDGVPQLSGLRHRNHHAAGTADLERHRCGPVPTPTAQPPDTQPRSRLLTAQLARGLWVAAGLMWSSQTSAQTKVDQPILG